jgi:hypothetical protein
MKTVIIDGVEYAPIAKKYLKFKIGQEHLGGIIFHVDKSGEHGLIAAKSDYFEKLTWHDAMKIFPIGDWRLPTKEELNFLYEQKDIVGGFAAYDYWSSSEYNILFAWTQYFSSGNLYSSAKNVTYYVRAVRAF